MSAIPFEVWLFSIKRLAQTYDMAITIYEQLSDAAKKELESDYKMYLEKQENERK